MQNILIALLPKNFILTEKIEELENNQNSLEMKLQICFNYFEELEDKEFFIHFIYKILENFSIEGFE